MSDRAVSDVRLMAPFGLWWWDAMPQVVHGASKARETPCAPVTPWGTEAELAVMEWTRTTAAVSLVDAIARSYRVQRRLSDALRPFARDVRRAIRWRAFHTARTAFGGPWGGWRWWVHPAVEAAMVQEASEASVRVATTSMRTDALRRLLLGFDMPARSAARVASAAHVAARWASASGLTAPSGRGHLGALDGTDPSRHRPRREGP